MSKISQKMRNLHIRQLPSQMTYHGQTLKIEATYSQEMKVMYQRVLTSTTIILKSPRSNNPLRDQSKAPKDHLKLITFLDQSNNPVVRVHPSNSNQTIAHCLSQRKFSQESIKMRSIHISNLKCLTKIPSNR